MKRLLFALSVALVGAALIGCSSKRCSLIPGCIQAGCADAPENCQSCSVGCDACGGVGCGACGGVCATGFCRSCQHAYEPAHVPGPPTGAVTYPYYTNRGPRDFLAADPPSIGP